MNAPRRGPLAGPPTTTSALVTAVLAGVVATACGGPGDMVEIGKERTASRPSLRAVAGATSAQRFGGSMAPSEGVPAGPASGLAFDTPPGWEVLPPSSLRPVNLRPAGHADAECYVTLLSGAGGGLTMNVDRWRKQLGLDPLPPGEAEELPEIPLLGVPAKFVDLEGAYSGMGDEARPGWRLLGVVLVRDDAAIFVKMTGPKDLVESERDRFFDLCASLRIEMEEGDTSAGAGAGAGAAPAGPLAWKAPSGWVQGEPRPMRLVSFVVGSESECYITLLTGDGGGLPANIDRWRGELGLEPTQPEEIDGMPRHPMLGRDAVLFEGVGEFSSMGGAPREDHAVLGAICLRGDDSVFVKLIGPREEVMAQRDGFLSFLDSLEEVAQ
ncbi:MAG: hypothetical protein ACYTG2_01210 [Planctomycetota bacterium]